MIRLSYRSQHISITELPTTELPDFTVLTGINGSGKTHLLEAIEEGKVEIDGIDRKKTKRYHQTDLIPQSEKTSSPERLRTAHETRIKKALNYISSTERQIARILESHGAIGDPRFQDPAWLAGATKEDIEEALEQLEDGRMGISPARLADVVYSNRRANLETLIGHLKGIHPELESAVKVAVEESGKSLLEVDEVDLRKIMPFEKETDEFLKLHFSDWFTSYHSQRELNRYAEYRAGQGDLDRQWLSDEEFEQRFGIEPWEITNSVLKEAGLRYRFNHPSGSMDTPFTLRLVDPSSDQEVNLEHLSSGEKILLSVALLLHRSSSSGGVATLPEVLLLDEIDAPLHPSFTHVLIQTLHDTLVIRNGIKIILTTHSPSTVAMAPEESLYEITRDPRAIVKCSKSHAIRGLTSGFISVAPSSVVVITESIFDADTYSKLLQAIQRFEGDQQTGLVPLTFIPASRVDHAGMGGGCDQVENWAPKLNDLLQYLGDFRGLIDKDDGSRTETDVIRILNRYSIENYLLDPLTIVAVLIKEGLTSLFPNCPIEDSHVHKLPDMEEGELQAMVDALCREAEAKNPELDTSGGTEQVTYLCGKTVELPKWVFDLRGHRSDADEHCLMRVFQRAVNPLSPTIIFPSGEHFFDRVIEMQTRILPAVIPNDLVEILHFLQSPEIKEAEEADAETPPQPESESEFAEE